MFLYFQNLKSTICLEKNPQYMYSYTVSYSCPNGITKLSDIFIREPTVGTLGVTEVKQMLESFQIPQSTPGNSSKNINSPKIDLRIRAELHPPTIIARAGYLLKYL